MAEKDIPSAEAGALGPFDPSAPRSRGLDEVVANFRNGSDTPRALLEACLERMASLEPKIEAFVHTNLAQARASADAATARYADGAPLSPIDGCPIAIKDIIETADMPTQMNSPIYAGWQSDRDAACVVALRQGGAVFPGKTVTTEFANGASGPTRNPYDPARTPGGSSSGSAAATAAGMVPVALGTQTAGSIVRPAAYCGVYGFKPSHAALNIGGIHPISLSHDTLGTLAGTLGDSWLVARYIAGQVGGTPPHPGLDGPEALPDPLKPKALARLYTGSWHEVDAATRAVFEAALDWIANQGVEILDRDSSPGIARLEELLEEVLTVAQTIAGFERRWPYNDYAQRWPEQLSDMLRERLGAANALSRNDYIAALDRQSTLRAQVEALRAEVDGFVTLTASGPAPVGLAHTGSRSFQGFWTLTASPAVTLPRLAVDGLPVGLQILGFRDQDADMMAVANWIDGLWWR